MTRPLEIREALLAFAARRFDRYGGLPPATTIDDVVAEFPVVGDHDAVGFLGRTSPKLRRRAVRVEGYPQPVRVWHDGQRVVLIDAEYPDLPEGWPAVRDALGEPDARLDHVWGEIRIERGEWIYARRGLAFFLGSAEGKPARVAAFSATTIDDYTARLRLSLRTIEHPGPIR